MGMFGLFVLILSLRFFVLDCSTRCVSGDEWSPWNYSFQYCLDLTERFICVVVNRDYRMTKDAYEIAFI